MTKEMMTALADAGYMPITEYVAAMVKAKEPDDLIAAALPKNQPAENSAQSK